MPRQPALHAAYLPPLYDLADVHAMRAVAAGTAEPEQQKRAIRWIVERAAGTYEPSFRPEGDRETCFAEGRRMVGLQIVKLVNMPGAVLDAMRKGPERGNPSEQV
jgi:hypothetical protein